MNLLIQEAVSSDTDTVISLWHQCELTRPWNNPRSDFMLAIKNQTSTIWLAKVESLLAGTVMVGFDGHRGWIYYLGTVPEFRNRDVARQLLNRSMTWLAERHCPKVELMVRSDNPAAKMYQRLGWERQDVSVFAKWLKDER
jgi:ribosomal protein S18 acetylase RimI-like enzyme